MANLLANISFAKKKHLFRGIFQKKPRNSMTLMCHLCLFSVRHLHQQRGKGPLSHHSSLPPQICGMNLWINRAFGLTSPIISFHSIRINHPWDHPNSIQFLPLKLWKKPQKTQKHSNDISCRAFQRIIFKTQLFQSLPIMNAIKGKFPPQFLSLLVTIF